VSTEPCEACAPLVAHLRAQVRRWYGARRREILAQWERDGLQGPYPGLPEEPPDLELPAPSTSISFGGAS
jgi:hypothetical protein